jgi:hypothetical protein
MKEKIIQIIGSGIEPERAELKANEIIINFNAYMVKVLEEQCDYTTSATEFARKIFINL